MAGPGTEREPLEIGEQVADVELTEKLGAGGGIHVYAGVREDGSKGVAFAVDGSLDLAVRDQFLTAAGELTGLEAEGVVPVAAIDPIAGAYVGDLEASGTLADIPLLSWDRKRTVALFRRLCEIVAALHDRGMVHGWLRPENVLLDGSLEPVVANPRTLDIANLCRTDPGMVWLHRVYAPPEVRHGATADTRADTYALGRIFHFALMGVEPDEKDERLPRLDTLLKDHPNAFARIVRKCTTSDAAQRYAHARELVEELDRIDRHVPVGLAHPDIDGKEETSMVDNERLRSVPPPKKRQRPAITIELKTDPHEQRFWSVGMAIGLGLLGALMLGGPMLVVQLTGLEAFSLEVVLWAAAVPIGFATPGFGPNKLLSRVFVVAAVAAVLVFTAPLELIREGRTAGLKSGDVAERVRAMKELLAQGEKEELRKLDLSGGDLTGMDLSGAALDGSTLAGAHCVGTKFTNASMENVDVSGADLSGADLTGTVGAWMKGLETAKCSETTRMPGGYTCQNGAPTRGN